MNNSFVKTALLFLLALVFGIQVTIVLAYYLASPYVAQLSAAGQARPGPRIRSQTNYVLTSCSTEELSVAVARVRAAVVYITGHPLTTSPSRRPLSTTGSTVAGATVVGDALIAAALTGDKMGSGIIFDPKGYILTNFHVIGEMSEIRVSLFADRERAYPATVVTKDPDADLAVIKIEAPYPLPVAKLGNSDMLEAADEVLAVGCPFNLEQSVSHGVVSDVKRTVNIDGRTYVDLIQTDAAINSGNSGGALIDENGEVVGINVAIYAPNRVYCGVGFAIPINRAKLLLMKTRYLSRYATATS
jgi:serine protease Do